jgi:hypothetical protein
MIFIEMNTCLAMFQHIVDMNYLSLYLIMFGKGEDQ